MKQNVGRIAFAVLIGLSVTTASASNLLGMDTSAIESDFGFNSGLKLYAGASFGYSTQDSTCENPFFEGSCDSGSVTGKFFGGARFNPMLGAELAYTSQDEATMSGKVGMQGVSGANKISGYQVTGIGYLPIQSIPNLELMGKAGVMFWERESEVMTANHKKLSTDDGMSPVLGLGAQYQLNKNIYLRTEWEHTINTGSDSDHETDLDSYSLGLSYSTL